MTRSRLLVIASAVFSTTLSAADDNQHAADENLRLQNLWDGIEIYAALFADLTNN